jgi:TPR repeat protein
MRPQGLAKKGPYTCAPMKWSALLLGSMLVCLGSCERSPHAPAGDSAPSPTTVKNPLQACADPAACDRRCAGGDKEGCLELGNSYSLGIGVSVDEPHAARLYEHACELRSGGGCMLAGRACEFGHGVSKSEERALGLYDRGCALEDQGACYNQALLLEQGRGAPRDLPRARALYQSVCRHGAPTACARVTELTP